MKTLAPKDTVMKCSECLYFKSQKKAGIKTCCKDNGVKAFAIAKSCFFPDITCISSNIEEFGVLANLFNSYTPKQKRILISLMQNAGKTNAKAHGFGKKIYVAVNGDGSYLNDWVSAYVLGYSNSKIVISGVPTKKTIGNSFTAYLDPSSVKTYSEFKKIKENLIKENRINNPRFKKAKRITSVDSYEPDVPTIDTVPHSWITKREEVKSKKKDAYERLASVLDLSYEG